MEIKPLTFKKQIIEIKETYIDADGKTKERIRSVEVPTGICEEDDVKENSDTSK